MKLLIDTHVFIWYTSDDPSVSTKALRLIQDPSNDVFLSVASGWEMAIKVQSGKLILKEPLEQLLDKHLEINAIAELPVRMSHALRVTSLPMHHRDPFDRILVAQAITEDLTLVSADPLLRKYSANVVW